MAATSGWFHGEAKRPAVILSLLLSLAAARAWSQNGLPSPHITQEQQQKLRRAQSPLPDAPSAVRAKQPERFLAFVEARSPIVGDAVVNASMTSESPDPLKPGVTPSFNALYGAPVVKKQSSVFVDKYLYPSLGNRDLQYHPSTSDNFVSRASDAAFRFIVPRDDSGKRRFNASYLLGVFASAAVATSTYRPTPPPVGNTIYRPYRAQTASATFGNFGSTVGGDAGRSIFHEFWPRLHQILRDHSLKNPVR